MLRIVILSGAGVSAESGLATFRDADGLWENHRIEDVATPQAWKKNPELVQRFYNIRRKQVIAAQPNAAHRFFAELERGANVTVITQNIDDLHERAGSSNVLHLHGNIRCAKSSGPDAEKQYFPIEGDELKMTDRCPQGFVLRPHVVWFGEEVPMLEKAARIISESDVFIVIGTSLNVYPAAGLIHYAKPESLKIVVDPKSAQLNLDKSYVHIASGAVDAVPELREILGNGKS